MPQESYVIGDVIGKGSYGEVTLARNKKDKKQYVIKKIDFRNASEKERLYAQQEVDILSKLKHPNIVSYRESFQTDEGSIAIVMGYCELGDLYTHLKEQSKLKEYLSESKIVEWFVQISMALQYMHDNHILHRDLKTQNIFLTKSKIIKVGDLGIARVLENNCDMATTMIGTPYYMSPELFSNKPYNHKSDVWALGCCLYEMATLKHAFNARDMNALVYKILKGKTPDMPSNYSSELREIIKSMLNYNPALRPSAAKILRTPYIKKQIAIFLEGTKNRRLVREEKRSSKKNNVSHDSGFGEVSNDDPQCIATASKVEIELLEKGVSNEQQVSKNNEFCNKKPVAKSSDRCSPKEVKSPPKVSPSEVARNPKPSCCGNRAERKGDERKEPSKPSDVRKILSDRIQAKSRQKRREDVRRMVVEKNVLRDPHKPSSNSTPENRNEKDVVISRVSKVRRELPVLPPQEKKDSPLPVFRCRDKPDRNNNDLVSHKSSPLNVVEDDEAAPQVSAGVPNLSARKKRRMRQQNSDSSIHTSPTHTNIKPNSFVSYESYTPPPQEEIIRDIRASRASIVGGSEVVDSPPPSEISPESGEDTLTPSSSGYMSESNEKGRKSSDVNSLIDTLQATLTMADRSKEHVAPEANDFFYDKKSDVVSPTSPLAAGRLRHRIEALRKECVDGIGERLLQRAYEIINNEPEDVVEQMLISLMGRRKFEEFGGPIWQLKFCEEF